MLNRKQNHVIIIKVGPRKKKDRRGENKK